VRCWEEHLIARLEAEASEPQVFNEEAESDCVPLGTLTALDEAKGWDVTLAQRIGRKNPQTLIRDLEPMLRSLVAKARRTFALEEAQEDDLKQKARIKIAEGLASFGGRSSFATWAYQVAWRTMVDEGKRVSGERRRELVGAAPEEEDLRDDTLPVDDRLTLWPVLRDALLTVPNAELVVLQELGYEDKEISQENIRMRRHRARAKLAKILAANSEILLHLNAPLASPEVVLATC
jgi:RNA polymerase sigma factor (sigma-70 family)